jgi:hypothetical protein
VHLVASTYRTLLLPTVNQRNIPKLFIDSSRLARTLLTGLRAEDEDDDEEVMRLDAEEIRGQLALLNIQCVSRSEPQIFRLG